MNSGCNPPHGTGVLYRQKGLGLYPCKRKSSCRRLNSSTGKEGALC